MSGLASGLGQRGTHGLLGPRIGRGIELDQGELDLDMGHRIEVLDLEHVDQALELRENLAQVPVVPRMAMVMRERPGSWVAPTVSDSMLKLRARSSPETRLSVPGRSTTRALTTCRRWTASGSPAGIVVGRRARTRHSAPPSTMSDSPLPGSIIG